MAQSFVLPSLGLTVELCDHTAEAHWQLRERLRVSKTRMLRSSQKGLVIHVPNQLPGERHHT